MINDELLLTTKELSMQLMTLAAKSLKTSMVLIALVMAHSAHAVQLIAPVENIMAPNQPAESDCVYFTLQGVAVADPAISPSRWLAVSKTHNGYIEMLVTLHAAKRAQSSVTVGTTGALGCNGYPTVSYMWY